VPNLELNIQVNIEKKTMNNITTVGIDLAKNVSHVVCCNQAGRIVKKKAVRRANILSYFRELKPCLVGVEACASYHYWAREISQLGHEVKQIAPQHVKAYVRGNKTDFNDALAIAEAVVRPEMRFVRTKTQAQQDIQALHVLRKKCERDRTANCNEIRGLLCEYGIVIPAGITSVYKQLPSLFDKQTDNGLSALFKELLEQHYQKLVE
jgi:transposase